MMTYRKIWKDQRKLTFLQPTQSTSTRMIWTDQKIFLRPTQTISYNMAEGQIHTDQLLT